MSDDFETQWEMAARTANWKCPACGAVHRKSEQIKRLTVARDRNEKLIVDLGGAACPKCNQPIDALELADGKYDVKSKAEKSQDALGCGFLMGIAGAIIAFIVVYQFYDWPWPLLAGGAAFGIVFALAYYNFKPS